MTIARSLTARLAVLGLSMLTTPEAFAAGDAAAGHALFSRCAACHSANPGVNKIGPSLAGIVGSKTGTVPGFNFSTAMKNANVTWDEGALDKFLKNPNGFIAGTKMFFNVSNAADRQNLIAYLATLRP
jgi:cytochrome c